MAALARDTERLGLMRVPTERMALYPPHTLERTEHQLNELINLGSGTDSCPLNRHCCTGLRS